MQIAIDIIDSLQGGQIPNRADIVWLLKNHTPADAEYAANLARMACQKNYGRRIFLRGLIEFSNVCRNDCYYCGIRKSNVNVARFCLSPQAIFDCCQRGYAAGLRTFVLQGGENSGFDAVLLDVVAEIRRKFPDCAITLSIGERPDDVYGQFFQAGANRFLLRHETASREHYGLLHPEGMSWQYRIDCLKALKRIGYQTGAGFMVGSPFQTFENLSDDLLFLHELQPEMVGIGPFIPHVDTPFATAKAGSLELTYFLLSLIRLILPRVLLPATTALETLDSWGRENGILAGANVIMPNISPRDVDVNYNLYNGKPAAAEDLAAVIKDLSRRMSAINYEISLERGDFSAVSDEKRRN